MTKSTTAQSQTRPKQQRDAENEKARIIFECLKRNGRVIELAKGAMRNPSLSFYISDDYQQELRKISPRPLLADFAVTEVRREMMGKEELKKIFPKGKPDDSSMIKFFKPSTIEILYPGLPKRFAPPGDPNPPVCFPPELAEYAGLSPIKAVDRKEKAIMILLRLNRSNKMIIKDIENFLGLLRREAKHFNLKLESPKTHWGELRKYLKIYDLHKKGRSWKEIALKVYKVDSAEDLERAQKRAKKGYGNAKDLINGGWKKL